MLVKWPVNTNNNSFCIWLHKDGKLHNSPELVIEVLSPGTDSERRDREVKLKLYSKHGVKEYWVVNWQEQNLEVYQREKVVFTLEQTLEGNDSLESPLLPVFHCKTSQIFKNI